MIITILFLLIAVFLSLGIVLVITFIADRLFNFINYGPGINIDSDIKSIIKKNTKTYKLKLKVTNEVDENKVNKNFFNNTKKQIEQYYENNKFIPTIYINRLRYLNYNENSLIGISTGMLTGTFSYLLFTQIEQFKPNCAKYTMDVALASSAFIVFITASLVYILFRYFYIVFYKNGFIKLFEDVERKILKDKIENTFKIEYL